MPHLGGDSLTLHDLDASLVTAHDGGAGVVSNQDSAGIVLQVEGHVLRDDVATHEGQVELKQEHGRGVGSLSLELSLGDGIDLHDDSVGGYDVSVDGCVVFECIVLEDIGSVESELEDSSVDLGAVVSKNAVQNLVLAGELRSCNTVEVEHACVLGLRRVVFEKAVVHNCV